MLLHVHSADGSTFLCEMTLWPPSRKYDAKSKIRFNCRKTIQNFSPIRYDGALVIFEERHANNNKMSSKMRSVPDPKIIQLIEQVSWLQTLMTGRGATGERQAVQQKHRRLHVPVPQSLPAPTWTRPALSAEAPLAVSAAAICFRPSYDIYNITRHNTLTKLEGDHERAYLHQVTGNIQGKFQVCGFHHFRTVRFNLNLTVSC